MKRVLLMVVGVILVAGGVLLVSGRFRAASRFEGRSAAGWGERLGTTSSVAQWEAERAIRALGSNALPELVKEIQAEDSALRSNVANLLRNRDLVPLLSESPAQASRQAAVQGFAALGAQSEAAVSALVQLLDNPRTADHASWALMQMDNRVIPALLVAVTNSGFQVRRRVIGDLGSRHTNAPGVEAALVERMQHDASWETRPMAAIALGQVPELSAFAIQALIDALEEPTLAQSAIQSLGMAGAKARLAIPALERILDEPGKYGSFVAGAAQRALHRIDATVLSRRGIVHQESPNPFE